MDKIFKKPLILLSKCIEFGKCRYNGQMIKSDFVNKLKEYVVFKPICPELEIGLGIPRNPIRIVENDGDLRLIQPETKRDVSKAMINFSNNFLDNLDIDGVILKSGSPSCGIKNVKIYPSEKKSAPIRKNKGFFGNFILDKFPFYPIEDEDRLRNHIIKEHFLRRIFIFASFRKVKNKRSINDLIKFHSINKYLIMSYNQKELRELGKITANVKRDPIEKILEEYDNHLKIAFSKPPKCNNNINVLKHTFGYISNNLKTDEKKLFLKTLKDFRDGHVGLSVPISLMKSWIIRFDQKYLKDQNYFSPYPDELMEVENIDFCAARGYWK